MKKLLLLLLCVPLIGFISCQDNSSSDKKKSENKEEESKYNQNILNQDEQDNSVNQNINSSNDFYVINTSATKKESLAKKGVEILISKGYESSYLWIPEYKSLSGAEYYSVYIGPFYTQSDCEKAVEEYRKIDHKAYALLVSQKNKRVEIRGIGKVKVIEPYHKENVNTEDKKNEFETKEVELCRCLNEPGNTDWARENKENCDEAISNKIGVSNWKSVNFSQNASLSSKWDKMVNDCVNNQLENDSKEKTLQEISFEEAKAFMQKRCENIGQMLLDGKTTYYNGGDFKVYYFISQSTQYSGYYCLSGVSSKKLEVLGDIDCGRDEIMSMFMNK